MICFLPHHLVLAAHPHHLSLACVNTFEVPCCPPSLSTFITHHHHPLSSPIVITHPPNTLLVFNAFKGVLSTSLSTPCIWPTSLGPGQVSPHMYASHWCILPTLPCLLPHTRRA